MRWHFGPVVSSEQVLGSGRSAGCGRFCGRPDDEMLPHMTGHPDGDGAEGADFFISYTRSDLRWAEWIGWVLEDAGFRVVMQAWDFGPGVFPILLTPI